MILTDFCVYFVILSNFVNEERNKNCNYSWEACTGPWEQLGLLNIYDFFLHDPDGHLCMFLDLLIGPSFFIIFHTP